MGLVCLFVMIAIVLGGIYGIGILVADLTNVDHVTADGFMLVGSYAMAATIMGIMIIGFFGWIAYELGQSFVGWLTKKNTNTKKGTTIDWRLTWMWAFWSAYGHFWFYAFFKNTGLATWVLIPYSPWAGLGAFVGMMIVYVPVILVMRYCGVKVFDKPIEKLQ